MILVDTGPLVALCDTRDRKHAAAVSHLATLVPRGLVVCEAVLVDACFLLPDAHHRARLHALCEDLRVEASATHDAAFRADVFAWLLKYADHRPDWADGCVAVLSGRHLNAKVWTYDREFRTTWRRLDGRAIPLAVRA
jgi:predicted nucleic acid-binding protein